MFSYFCVVNVKEMESKDSKSTFSVKLEDNGMVEITHNDITYRCHIDFLTDVISKEFSKGDGMNFKRRRASTGGYF